MDGKEIAERLTSICRLDMHSLRSYMIAYDQIGNGDIRNTILKFEADHGGHIDELERLIRSLGGEPPEESAEFANMKFAAGTEDALKTLLAGEKLIVKSLEDAVCLGFPTPVLALIKRILKDEVRHLNYLDLVLKARAWIKAA